MKRGITIREIEEIAKQSAKEETERLLREKYMDEIIDIVSKITKIPVKYLKGKPNE